MKLSDYVIQFVIDLGVKHVFLLPGGGAMHLNDSLGGRAGDIESICTLHEQAAAIAAENYAKATGQIGVGLFTTGPGSTNAVTGVAGAWLDSTPCLFLSGQVKRSDLKGRLRRPPDGRAGSRHSFDRRPNHQIRRHGHGPGDDPLAPRACRASRHHRPARAGLDRDSSRRSGLANRSGRPRRLYAGGIRRPVGEPHAAGRTDDPISH